MPCKAITETRPAEGQDAARRQVSDPAGRKLVDWYLYRGGYGTAGEIRAFLVANPAWPDRERLDAARRGGAVQRARPARARSRRSSPTRRRRPASGWPRSPRPGCRQGRGHAPRRWPPRPGSEYDIPAVQEAAFLKKVGSLLTEADHKRRLDRLLLNDSRWAGERNERAAAIRRVHRAAARSREKKKAEARLAVFLHAKNSNQLLDQAAAAGAQDRMGPRHPEGAGAAPAEQGRGGLEDPARRAGADRCR